MFRHTRPSGTLSDPGEGQSYRKPRLLKEAVCVKWNLAYIRSADYEFDVSIWFG